MTSATATTHWMSESRYSSGLWLPTSWGSDVIEASEFDTGIPTPYSMARYSGSGLQHSREESRAHSPSCMNERWKPNGSVVILFARRERARNLFPVEATYTPLAEARIIITDNDPGT